jgi:hypothetical protein
LIEGVAAVHSSKNQKVEAVEPLQVFGRVRQQFKLGAPGRPRGRPGKEEAGDAIEDEEEVEVGAD